MPLYSLAASSWITEEPEGKIVHRHIEGTSGSHLSPWMISNPPAQTNDGTSQLDHDTGNAPYSFRTVPWVLLRPTGYQYPVLWDGTHCLSSLSEKTRKSNHLQMTWQDSTFSSVILRTWVLVRPRFEPSMGVRCSTNWANRSAVQTACNPIMHFSNRTRLYTNCKEDSGFLSKDLFVTKPPKLVNLFAIIWSRITKLWKLLRRGAENNAFVKITWSVKTPDPKGNRREERP